MQALARNGYSAEQVRAALHAARREVRFRYELLNSGNQVLDELDDVLGARVAHNSLAQIHRTARFTLRDTGQVNFLADRIKPYVRVRMSDGGWAEFPLGVFLLSTPPRKTDASGVIMREVEAYDQLQVLRDDRVEDRYTAAAGTNYVTAVSGILTGAGITMQNLVPTALTLPVDRDWPPGTEKVRIINDLLRSINYRALWFDEDGRAVAAPYASPSQRPSEYTYRDDDESVIFPDPEQGIDLFDVPNKWVLVVSEADRPVLTASYTNSNPNSPTSTVSRGRTIVDFRQVDAADQDTLNCMAERLAFEASQVYEQVEFETAIMPMHSHADVYTLEYGALAIAAKYSEVAWEMELRAGARMKHRIRRVVQI